MCFSFFQKFDFLGFKGGKRAKNDPKGQKTCLSHSFSETVSHMIVVFGTHV